MNKMVSLHQADPGNGQRSEKEIQETVTPFQHEINITDGGEFLDDSLRMTDQPLGETDEKSIIENAHRKVVQNR